MPIFFIVLKNTANVCGTLYLSSPELLYKFCEDTPALGLAFSSFSCYLVVATQDGIPTNYKYYSIIHNCI